MEALQLTDNGEPLGEVATYSLRRSSTPFNPTDSSGELPSFTVSLTDLRGDAKTLAGKNVSLRDWTGRDVFGQVRGTRTKGRVASVRRNSDANLVNLDANTIFERLNTEQTVLPVTQQDAVGGDVTLEGITQMCLAAGVPEYSVGGNLRYYVSKYSQIGYIGGSDYKWRYFGPTTTYKSYVTTESTLGGYDRPLDVNLSQGVTFGMIVDTGIQVAEFRVQAYLPHVQQNVIYTIRHDNNSWYVYEKVGSATTTTLQVFVRPLTISNTAWFFVDFKANAADATKVDIKSRIMEYDISTRITSFTDHTATGVVSTLRNRPQPFELELGYDPSITSGKTFDIPSVGFVTQAADIQETYPDYQLYIGSGGVSFSTATADKAKLPKHIPGFTGNIWDKLREFCAIYDFDIVYNLDQIGFMMREVKRRGVSDQWIPAVNLSKSNVVESVNARQPARKVEVKVYPQVVDTDNNSVMFKATSVYTIEKGETKVEKVQTNNSFQYLSQPVAVSGVPVPYTSAFGSYVITGADGFIVDPAWWRDNGGSITVKPTGVSGEIEITMQAPTVDTVRAPYRVSEGAADRPALYIMGYGIALQEPHTIEIYTGNTDASQDVGATLDSTFVMNDIGAFNVGHRLAEVYGTGEASISFNSGRGDYVPPDNTYIYPTYVSDSVYWNGSYYRITSEIVNPNGLQYSDCLTHNTIGVINGEFAETKTVGDWNNLHDQQTIADTNMAPLPYHES